MSIYTAFNDNLNSVLNALNTSTLISETRAQYDEMLTKKQIAPVKFAELKLEFEVRITQMLLQYANQSVLALIQAEAQYDKTQYYASEKMPLYIDTNGTYYTVDETGIKAVVEDVTSYQQEFALVNMDGLMKNKQITLAGEQISLVTAQTAYQTAQTDFTAKKTVTMEQSRIDNILKDVSQIKSDFIGMVALGGAVAVAGDFTGLLTAQQALADRIASVNGDPISTISLGSSGQYTPLGSSGQSTPLGGS
jgi:hypothetical protein